MKFTYVDESGNGVEPVLVMAGIVTDATRMHITKKEWGEIKKILSEIVTEFPEWKTSQFYKGCGQWKTLNGEKRSQVITYLIKWMKKRKHKVHFTAIDKQKLNNPTDIGWAQELLQNNKPMVWCWAAMHYIFSLDKHHKSEKGVKGHTVYVFDRSVQNEDSLISFIQNPPDWSHSYHPTDSETYKKKNTLDTVVDVPYFVNSKHVQMIELADFVAFLLRAYIEVKDNYRDAKYIDELEKLTSWSKQIKEILISKSCRFPSTKKTDLNRLFEEISPNCIKTL